MEKFLNLFVIVQQKVEHRLPIQELLWLGQTRLDLSIKIIGLRSKHEKHFKVLDHHRFHLLQLFDGLRQKGIHFKFGEELIQNALGVEFGVELELEASWRVLAVDLGVPEFED